MSVQGSLYYDLKAIEARDPDGGDVEPTDIDYEAHKAWAIRNYGQSTWDRYVRGGWDLPEV